MIFVISPTWKQTDKTANQSLDYHPFQRKDRWNIIPVLEHLVLFRSIDQEKFK